MSEFVERTTEVTLVVRTAGAPDLTDPIVRRTVIPELVKIGFQRTENADGMREYASVSIYGSRRLKNGEPGKTISSYGWDSAVLESHHGVVYRPQWLTDLLAAHLPEGWSPSLLDLPGGGSR